MSLQREYLLLIFIAFAVWIAMRDVLTYKHRLLIGFFFGLAAVIKPHAAIAGEFIIHFIEAADIDFCCFDDAYRLIIAVENDGEQARLRQERSLFLPHPQG